MVEPRRTGSPSSRDALARGLVVGGSKLSAVGALAAVLGVAQALSWIEVEGNRASEMGVPSLIGAGAAAMLVVVGVAIARQPLRDELLPIAGRWLGFAALVGATGALLLSR